MADVDDIQQQKDADDTEKPQESKSAKTDEKGSGGGILPWIITFVVVVLCGGAGFALARFFGSSGRPETAGHSQEGEPAEVGDLKADGSATDSQETWYYDLEPVVANLDVADVTRYVRASLTIEISSEVDEKKGTAFLKEKKPILTNWLTVYLASQSLDDVRGERNLKRIQSQILDVFNEQVFPDSKPHIKRILFKEFAVQ